MRSPVELCAQILGRLALSYSVF
uniref:Uncharacterized protein n=1 Tax=Anguilla anguilla TaxID=7936 RepID=A0A0E9TUC7_ANGAN